MTNNKLLDQILHCYLFGQQLKLDDNPLYTKLTFEFIVKSQDKSIDKWCFEFLKNQLVNDGFIEPAKYGDGEPFELTAKGITAAQTSWYSSLEEERVLDKEIKRQTLRSLKRSKEAIIISIFAILIPTILSIYTLWATYDSSKSKELNTLEQKLGVLENKVIQQSQKFDSLKKLDKHQNGFDSVLRPK
jgi:hypothetical protein